MRAEEVRALSDSQLAQELENAHRELFNLRFRHVTRQLENPQLLRVARREIARILTNMRQRELATERG